MATIVGNPTKSFIHVAGDGRTVPNGFVEVVGVTAGDDKITGLAAGDIIFADGGDDRIDGGGGADQMNGGTGDDIFLVDNEDDKVVERANEGTDRAESLVSYSLASQHIESLTLLGSLDLNATGNSLANTLVGNSGRNILDGGTGVDAMSGLGGDDTYIVDNVGDTVVEKADSGTDTIKASVTFSLAGQHIEALTLTGTGNINATGNSLANALAGNSGRNILDGGTGADAMSGLGGDDTYIVDNVGDTVVEKADSGTDTVKASVTFSLAGQHIEALTLTGTGNINATGNSLANTLVGNSGRNILDGGTGVDVMQGGLGDDVYKVDNASDRVVEGSGLGTDLVQSSVSFSLVGQHIENLTLTGSRHTNGTGNSLHNVIIGNTGNNGLTGGSGNDRIEGGGGRDILNGESGRDLIFGDAGNDTLDGGAGDDTVDGGEGNDTILIGTGNDTLYGGSGDDFFDVGPGRSRFTANGGADEDGQDVDTLRLNGAIQFDWLILRDQDEIEVVNFNNNALSGSIDANEFDFSGVDKFVNVIGPAKLGLGNDSYVGHKGVDRVDGGADDDTLDGGAGADILVGGEGNDTLIGGDGDDVLDGGRGNNLFLLVGEIGADKLMASAEGGNTNIVRLDGAVVAKSLRLDYSAFIEVLDFQENTLAGTNDENYFDISGLKIVSNFTQRVFLEGANDTYIGHYGSDIVDGGEGNDAIYGLAGNDTLTGGSGDDLLDGGLGNDVFVLQSEGGSDIIRGGSDPSKADIDTVKLEGSQHRIILDADADIERLELNRIGGTQLDDMIDFSGVATVADLGFDPEFALGFGGGDDTYIGSTLSIYGDFVKGGAGNDKIDGGAGNDRLYGGAGNDTLIGGLGHDVFVIERDPGGGTFDPGIDTFDGGAGNDAVLMNAPSIALTRLILDVASGVELLVASIGEISGTLGDDTFDLSGLSVAGFSDLDLKGGNDRFTSGASGDLVYGGDGNDILIGLGGSDNLVGGEGDDTISGGADGDHLFGDNGNNKIEGGDGDDNLYGGADTDTFSGGDGNDVLTAGGGTDALNGEGGDDELHGDAGNDTLNGGADADLLRGDAGLDTLNGGDAADNLAGGKDNDTLIGGDGADTFSFLLDEGVDVVRDFNSVDGGLDEGDRLAVRVFKQSSFFYIGSDEFTGSSARCEARVSGNKVQVDSDGDGDADITITLTGLSGAGELSQNDFVLI